MKLTLRLMGIAGVMVFGLVLALSYASPIQVERAGRTFIQAQIERQIEDGLGIGREEGRDGRVGHLAEALAERHAEEIAALRERLATGLNARIAAAVARMQDLSCECRQRMLQGLDAATALRISKLEHAEPQLRRVIEGRYGEIVADLLRDLRIFAATNLIAFLLLLILSVLKPDRVRQLFVPGVLLGVAALTSGTFYLLGRNWFFTILYGDYVGWAYALWLLLVFGLFCDVALFRARITTRIVDAMLAVAGKAPIPC
jgi:hypothetical protein